MKLKLSISNIIGQWLLVGLLLILSPVAYSVLRGMPDGTVGNLVSLMANKTPLLFVFAVLIVALTIVIVLPFTCLKSEEYFYTTRKLDLVTDLSLITYKNGGAIDLEGQIFFLDKWYVDKLKKKGITTVKVRDSYNFYGTKIGSKPLINR